MQIIKQTDRQKTTMYMKLPKKKLVNMLIQCNKIIDSMTPIVAYNTQLPKNNIGCLRCKGSGLSPDGDGYSDTPYICRTCNGSGR